MDTLAQRWQAEDFQAAVAQAARAPDRTGALVSLLLEGHPGYQECGVPEVARRRGWVLAELGKASVQPAALPMILEELETGDVPYLLAAAARALRQTGPPRAEYAHLVARALQALSRHDDRVDLARWGGQGAGDACGLAADEVLATLRWLGVEAAAAAGVLQALADAPRGLEDRHVQGLRGVIGSLPEQGTIDAADCCRLPTGWRREVRSDRIDDASKPVFEDQEGQRRSWGDVFAGHVSVVAFFYTRCDNDLKCSLTISKLARLRQLPATQELASLGVFAITYDPDFDLPHRLKRYGQSRGLAFGERVALLRAVEGREWLERHFANSVGFAGSSVNRHRTELFVLDSNGAVAVAYHRLQWAPEEVLADAASVSRGRASRPARSLAALARTASPAGALALVLLPKCPICGAAYLSLTGLAALPYLPAWTGLWPLAMALVLANAAAVFRIGRTRRQWKAMAWTLSGAALLLLGMASEGGGVATALGLGATSVGSLLSVAGAWGMPSGWRVAGKAAAWLRR
ncbi:MAG: SCO family protein [Ramlibacter sp.]|nr:SCO family protein [Ramlibacter sp.]